MNKQTHVDISRAEGPDCALAAAGELPHSLVAVVGDGGCNCIFCQVIAGRDKCKRLVAENTRLREALKRAIPYVESQRFNVAARKCADEFAALLAEPTP